jgi:hypothetical protein
MNRTTTVRAISRKQFDTFAPARSVISTIILQEVEWFRDDDCVVIGFVARDKTEDDWSLYVLGPDVDGKFRPIVASTGMRSLDEARSRLLDKMAAALASGGVPLPEGGDYWSGR